jgi:hypothetical protein
MNRSLPDASTVATSGGPLGGNAVARALSAVRTVPGLTALFALLLLASFVFQYPTSQVADWQLYSFYDPGTILKGDLLLEKGYVPTRDFGYTHGLISLLYGRVGFSLLGRTPGAFFALTLLTELGMAWALARIAVATGIARAWPALAFLVIGLPMAIMPTYLTLTHPLEAMLILLALAAQVDGKKPLSLVLMTACLFVKPSMAYVYGFVLMVLLVIERRRSVGWLVAGVLPAGVTLVVLAALLTLRFGGGAVYKTLLPFTGAKTYASTGFGFFTASGRSFWLTPELWRYIGSPTGIFLIAAGATALGAVLAGVRLMRDRASAAAAGELKSRGAWELLMTIGILHTAFIVGFYGWAGSWTYYSYLPVLGLTLAMRLFVRTRRERKVAFVVLGTLMFFSHGMLIAVSLDGWRSKSRDGEGLPGAANGLYRYAYLWDDWKAAMAQVGTRRTVVMSNGYLFDLPGHLEMPDAWFPEPGIPTAAEVERVKAQVARAQCVLLWNEYGAGPSHPDLRLWAFPEFEKERGEFEEEFTTPNGQLTVLRRVKPAMENGK